MKYKIPAYELRHKAQFADKCFEYSVYEVTENRFIAGSFDKEHMTNLLHHYKTKIGMAKILPLQTLSHQISQARREKAYKKAEKLCKQLLKYYPDWHGGFIHMGIIYMSTGRQNNAITYLRKAIKLKEDCHEAYNNLGAIYQARQDWDNAIKHYSKGLEFAPGHTSTLFNLGVVYKSIFKLYEAEECFEKVLGVKPDDARTVFHYATLLDMMKRFDEATDLFNHLVELLPHSISTKILVFIRQLRECDWSNYEEGKQLIIDSLLNSDDDSSLHVNNLVVSSLPLPLPCFKRISELHGKVVSKGVKPFTKPPVNTNSPLRIGYLSSDLRWHPVGKLLYDMFRHHDRTKFEVHAFASHPHITDDEFNKKIQEGVDFYYDIHTLSDERCASLIRENKIDILVDLNGYTFGNRIRVMAFRPALLQCTWLGYPNSLYCPGIDYLVADKTLVPPEYSHDYSEQILYLPNNFVGSPVNIKAVDASRKLFNLPEDKFLFACLNSHYKITPTVFQAWATILNQCPNSLLALAQGRGKENLLRYAKKYSVDDRLLFVDRVALEREYIARYSCFDVYLDTFFYTAGSTAVAVMLAGLPMLSVLGMSNSSRMGCSVMRTAGFEEGVCYSSHEYVEKAVNLYYNQEKRRLQREQLQDTGALFNMSKFVKDFESLMLKTYSKIKKTT